MSISRPDSRQKRRDSQSADARRIRGPIARLAGCAGFLIHPLKYGKARRAKTSPPLSAGVDFAKPCAASTACIQFGIGKGSSDGFQNCMRRKLGGIGNRFCSNQADAAGFCFGFGPRLNVGNAATSAARNPIRCTTPPSCTGVRFHVNNPASSRR